MVRKAVLPPVAAGHKRHSDSRCPDHNTVAPFTLSKLGREAGAV